MPIIILTVVLLVDLYAFQGVKVISKNLSSTGQSVVKWSFWGLTGFIVLMSIGVFTGILDRSSTIGRTVFFGTIFITLLPKVVFIVFLLGNDVWRGISWVIAKLTPAPPAQSEGGISRSEFITKTGLAVAAVPFIATGWGIVNGAHDYHVRRKRVVVPNLPKEFDGIRIAQLSDIHSGSFFKKKAVQGGVEMLNAEKPDVLFFTGDLVNDVADEVKEYVPIFEKCRADLGVYSILGNHDYGDYVSWPSKQAWEANMQDLYKAHELMGWKLMRNENTKLKVDGASIGLIGIENWGLGFSKHGDLAKAYQGMEEELFKILLSHDPSHWDAEIRPKFSDIDLTLAGHTHGMQMGLRIGEWEWSPSSWRYKQWGGLYQEGDQQIYVNRGFGFIGMPARIGMPPEITILELVREA